MKIFKQGVDTHRFREAWRHYRCVVEFFGVASLQARITRSRVAAMLQLYTPTSVQLDERRNVLGKTG